MVSIIVYLSLSVFLLLVVVLQKRSHALKKLEVFNEFKARGIEPIDENGQCTDKEFERICHEIDGTKFFFISMILFVLLHLPGLLVLRFSKDKKTSLVMLFLPSYLVILPALYLIF